MLIVSQSHKDSYRSKLKGPEEFTDTIKNLRSAFPDLHYEEQEIISQGNKIIFVGNVTGTHSGNFSLFLQRGTGFLMKQCTSIR
jgi:predicted ester cyclase